MQQILIETVDSSRRLTKESLCANAGLVNPQIEKIWIALAAFLCCRNAKHFARASGFE
jgi:hypothetical protein